MKSLRRRLFGLPIVIVVIVSVAVMLLFNIVVSGYVDNQVEQSMNSFREYHVAMDNLQEKIDKIQSKNGRNDSDLSKSEAEMNLLTDSFNSSSNAVTTQMVVLDDAEYLNDYATDIEKKLISYYNENSEEIARKVIVEAEIDGETYRISTAKFRVYDEEKSNVLIYTNISSVNGMIDSVNKVLLLVIAMAGLIAIFIGFVMTKSISSSLYGLKEFIQGLGEEDGDRSKDRIYYTEFMEMADFMEEQSDELMASQKLQKLIFQNASHELRTPLAVIKAECEYALGANADEADRLEALESVSKQGDKMAQLVDALLAVSRAEQGRGRLKLERLDIGETVRDICDGFVTDKGISLTCTAGNGLSVLADRALIGRLLDNLLSNAVRYGREGGKIEVTVTRVGDNAEIKVSDDGIGIAQEDIPKIWDRFYRADPSRSSDGFGLGLALVRQIALLPSGSVGVESRLGDGSTFTVTLPLDK